MSPGSIQDGRLLVTQPLVSLREVMFDDCRQKPSTMFSTALKSAKYNGLGMCVCVWGGDHYIKETNHFSGQCCTNGYILKREHKLWEELIYLNAK